ncbi:hypothetical protein JCM30394_16800 [Deferrisoma palaeochoriense]
MPLRLLNSQRFGAPHTLGTIFGLGHPARHPLEKGRRSPSPLGGPSLRGGTTYGWGREGTSPGT